MTYIIAELGSVHDGSIGNALKLIEHCAEADADAIKLQDHRGEKIKGDPPWFAADLETRGAYLKRTSFNQDQWRIILDECERCQVDLVVSPFSAEAVELLEAVTSLRGVKIAAYKVASGQVTNLEMLRAIGRTGRRVILSSGMTTFDELQDAREALGPGSGHWATLVCTSSYPCPPEQVGVNNVQKWGHPGNAWWAKQVGLSDHTLGFAASLAAIALGATVIERHVCFDRRGYGTDCAHSLTLDEFAAFVREVRALDVMLANPVSKDDLVNTPAMQAMRAAFLEIERTEA